jgi:hypothetical protein
MVRGRPIMFSDDLNYLEIISRFCSAGVSNALEIVPPGYLVV